MVYADNSKLAKLTLQQATERNTRIESGMHLLSGIDDAYLKKIAECNSAHNKILSELRSSHKREAAQYDNELKKHSRMIIIPQYLNRSGH